MVWPLFDLSIDSSKLSLRVATDQATEDLAKRSVGRVLKPEEKNFMGAWTQLASPEFERGMLQHVWLARAQWQPDDWMLSLNVFPQGREAAVGNISLSAKRFLIHRSVSTGSWILPEYRGSGLGREARALILHLAFADLGSIEARSAAHPNNVKSHRVSESLGYLVDGSERQSMDGETSVPVTRFLLTRDRWQRRDDITINNFAECRQMFGL